MNDMTHPAKPKLDGFEFLDCLGGGAFGQVWLALDLKLNIHRAVKLLPRERFQPGPGRAMRFPVRRLPNGRRVRPDHKG
jgi:hypothetical protein